MTGTKNDIRVKIFFTRRAKEAKDKNISKFEFNLDDRYQAMLGAFHFCKPLLSAKTRLKEKSLMYKRAHKDGS